MSLVATDALGGPPSTRPRPLNPNRRVLTHEYSRSTLGKSITVSPGSNGQPNAEPNGQPDGIDTGGERHNIARE
jgi:hypothetical protein